MSRASSHLVASSLESAQEFARDEVSGSVKLPNGQDVEAFVQWLAEQGWYGTVDEENELVVSFNGHC